MTAEEALKSIFEDSLGAEGLAKLIKVIADEYGKSVEDVEREIAECKTSPSLEMFLNCVKAKLQRKLIRKLKP